MVNVDLILSNALVLTMDENFNQFEPGAVAIRDNKIAAVGPEAVILESCTAENHLDCDGKVLMPGLVNAHTHVPMTLLRGLADDLRLDVWLMGYMMPVERQFVSPQFVRLGTQLACAEMIRSGVTTFADMYYFEDEVATATAEAGMRAVCSQTILKFPTPDASSYEDALEAARDFIKKWKGHNLIVPSIAPHAPYTCTDEILQAATDIAQEFDVPLHTHLSETAFEVENMRKEMGMPVIPYVKKQRLLEAKTLAAHCVHIDEGEIHTLEHAGAGVAHNPSSNMKLASGMAPVQRMLDIGLNVGIGTDGTASNNDLDMFEEVRLAAFLAKVGSGDPTALPARTALLMATRMGANALHLGDIIGSLEPGKRADLALVDIDQLHNAPRFRRDPLGPYSQLVYASKASDVTDVMIEGKWVMRDRELLTLNEVDILEHSQDYARQIDQFLVEREQSVLSKLIAIGGATQEESFEVQAKVNIADPKPVLAAIENSGFEILYRRHYREYDSYFSFDDPDQGMLRYREDHFVAEDGSISQVRNRLTLIGTDLEHPLSGQVVLSRSRYIAPATQTLRFYREYFKPSDQIEVEKERLRFRICYMDTVFYINIDTLTHPDKGHFLEIKSRTWSRQDAQEKSRLVSEMITRLGADADKAITGEYFKIVAGQ